MSSLAKAPNNPGKPAPIKKIPSKISQEISFYDHQVEGIRWLAGRKSWLLGDEQGLGKTIQALTVAALDFDRGWANRILVVAGTKQLKYQWADEIAKLTHFSCLILDGTPTQRNDQLLKFGRGGIDILIVNYEQLAKHCKAFNFLGFQIIIVDECHEVKNADAQRTKAIHQLKAERWFLLSGTPILNRPDELWSPLKLIDPETPEYSQWVNKHCLYSTSQRKVVGVKKKGELKAYLETVMLRCLKRDCLDLPDKQYIRVNIELSPYQRQVYRDYQEELWEKLPAAPNGMQRQAGLAQALRLRQICSTPFNVGLEDDSAKLDEAVDRIDDLMANDHKLVCFTQFRGTLACMERRLEERGIKYWALHGDVKGPDRNDFVREWTQSSDPGVLLCMYQVAGVGLNLTAARHAMMIDKLYVPGKMDQAEDRVHRIGQSVTQPVQIIELIARRSYEEKVERILNDKGAMIDTLVPNSGWDQKMYEAILERD